MRDFSVLPDSRAERLSEREQRVLDALLNNWPSHPLEIAEQLGEDTHGRVAKRKASTKYSYYLKKLVSRQLVLSKKVGNGLIFWPLQVEKYRTVHDILR